MEVSKSELHHEIFLSVGRTGSYENQLQGLNLEIESNQITGILFLKRGFCLSSIAYNLEYLLEEREIPTKKIDKTKSKILEYRKKAVLDFEKGITLGEESAFIYQKIGTIKKFLKEDKSAISNYTKAIELEPLAKDETKFLAYESRGNLRSNSGDIEGALEDFIKAVECKTSSFECERFDLIKTIVRAKLKSKSYKDAIYFVNRIIDYYPENSLRRSEDDIYTSYHLLGDCKCNLGDFTGAINDLSKGIEILKSRDLKWRRYGHLNKDRAEIRFRMKEYNLAILDYTEAITYLSSADDRGDMQICYLNKSICRLKSEKNPDVFDDIWEAIRLSGGGFFGVTSEIITPLIKNYLDEVSDSKLTSDASDNYSYLLKYYTKAIKNNTSLISFLYEMRANTKYNLKEYKEAIADYKKAIFLSDSYNLSFDHDYFDKVLHKGIYSKSLKEKEPLSEYIDSIDYEKDKDCWLKVREILSKNIKKINRIEKKIDDSEKIKKKIKKLDQIIKINSNDSDAFYKRATLKRDLGNKEDALDDYMEAIKYMFINWGSDELKSRCYFYSSICEARLGEEKEAIQSFKRSIGVWNGGDLAKDSLKPKLIESIKNFREFGIWNKQDNKS
tara:strand:+ start:5242 stop:7086 length:1845 start_codon:yes stop_codon:yes gene_type:complete